MERQSLAAKDIFEEHARKLVKNYAHLAYKAEINQNIIQFNQRRFRNKKHSKNIKNINDNTIEKNHLNCQKHYKAYYK